MIDKFSLLGLIHGRFGITFGKFFFEAASNELLHP